jgi:glucan phosphoethanolaminetransferase (alkaline phosphatase superfamily)
MLISKIKNQLTFCGLVFIVISCISSFLTAKADLSNILLIKVGTFICIFTLQILILHLVSAIFSFNATLFKMIFFVIALTSALTITLQINNGFIITPQTLYAALHPEHNEVSTIMGVMDYVIIAIVVSVSFVFVFANRDCIKLTFTRFYLGFLATFCCATLLFCFAMPQSFWHKTFGSQKKNNIHKAYFIKNIIYSAPVSVLYSALMLVNTGNKNNAAVQIETFNHHNGDSDLKIYYIIGESLRFDRMGINGYGKNTTPNLVKESKSGRLINFKMPTISCGITTAQSVPCMLSGSLSGSNFDLLKIFKSAGFYTTLRSPHSTHIFKPILPSLLTNCNLNLNNYIRDGDIEVFIKKDVIEFKNRKTFSVVQMLGSHSYYGIEKLIANKSNILMPICKKQSLKACFKTDGKLAMDNSYDNTVIYTDEILAKIFKLLQDENAIIFFAPDHAEMLGEDDKYGHGIVLPNGKEPEIQKQIPFFVWMSSRYIKQHKDIYGSILNKSTKPTNHLAIYQSIISCSGIKVKNLDTIEGGFCNSKSNLKL